MRRTKKHLAITTMPKMINSDSRNFLRLLHIGLQMSVIVLKDSKGCRRPLGNARRVISRDGHTGWAQVPRNIILGSSTTNWSDS
jgi:hypothetical protein